MDYDRWADEPGREDWRYSSCLPYFKAGETSDRGPDDWRGGGGPLGVTRGSSDNPLYDVLLEAGAQAGQGTTDDPNGYDPEGVSRLDATRSNGRRCSAARAYLHPSLSRANLTLKTRAMVTRLVISGNRASGVVYTHGGESHTVEAEREVILSGGAINSPQTLMLSGIGPADHLREHGIEVRCDLPGVGRNLQDHARVAMMWSCTRSFPVHRVNRPLNKLLAGAEWFLTRGGLASSNHFEAGGLIRGNQDVAYPNLQYHFGPTGYEYEGTRLKLTQAFMLQVDQLRPGNHGHIALRSADPGEKPAMFFRYLSDPARSRPDSRFREQTRLDAGQPVGTPGSVPVTCASRTPQIAQKYILDGGFRSSGCRPRIVHEFALASFNADLPEDVVKFAQGRCFVTCPSPSIRMHAEVEERREHHPILP